jgi:hypothetical protein
MNTKGRMSQINDERPLTKICYSGSDDAGMYHSKVFEVVKTFIFPLTKASALIHTQRLDMKSQLERGVRYFEVSPQYLSSPVTLINKLISRLNIILDLDFLIAPTFAFLGLKDTINNLSGSLEESSDDNLIMAF